MAAKSSTGIACAVLVLCAGCRSGLAGSGVEKTETRAMQQVARCIELHGAMEVAVAIGENPSLVVQGDDNLLAHLKTSVNGPCLSIGTDIEVRPTLPLQVAVQLAGLDEVTADGANKVEVKGLQGPAFRVHLSGASAVELAGEVTRLTVEVSGMASVKAQALKTHEAKVNLSGAGSVAVFADQVLDAHVSGAGKIDVWGKPAKIEKEISGVGILQTH